MGETFSTQVRRLIFATLPPAFAAFTPHHVVAVATLPAVAATLPAVIAVIAVVATLSAVTVIFAVAATLVNL